MRATAALVSSSRARAAVLVGHGNTSHGRCAARRVELQRPIAAVHAMTPADYYAGQPLYRMSNGKVVVANAALASGSGGGISGGSGGGAGGQHGASTVARAKSAGALATPQPDVVPVQFVVPHFATSFGQVLKVVGALEELGGWAPERAPTMTWNEGHTWTLELPLPAGTLQFKVLMEEQGGGVRWEEGGDRSVALPTTTQGAVPVGSVGIACHWGDTGATSVKARPDKGWLRRQLELLEAKAIVLRGKAGSAKRAPEPAKLQVPLVRPEELPPITSAALAADVEARFKQLGARALAGDAAALPTNGIQAAAGVSARVLGSTVEQLLATARDALDREGPEIPAVMMGAAECEAERAAILMMELTAATAALELEVNSAVLAPKPADLATLTGAAAPASAEGVLAVELPAPGAAADILASAGALGAQEPVFDGDGAVFNRDATITTAAGSATAMELVPAPTAVTVQVVPIPNTRDTSLPAATASQQADLLALFKSIELKAAACRTLMAERRALAAAAAAMAPILAQQDPSTQARASVLAIVAALLVSQQRSA